jgi:hypothetical protein
MMFSILAESDTDTDTDTSTCSSQGYDHFCIFVSSYSLFHPGLLRMTFPKKDSMGEISKDGGNSQESPPKT